MNTKGTSIAVVVGIVIGLIVVGALLKHAEGQRIDNYVVHHQCVEIQRTERTNMRVYRCDTGVKTELDMSYNEPKEAQK